MTAFGPSAPISQSPNTKYWALWWACRVDSTCIGGYQKGEFDLEVWRWGWGDWAPQQCDKPPPNILWGRKMRKQRRESFFLILRMLSSRQMRSFSGRGFIGRGLRLYILYGWIELVFRHFCHCATHVQIRRRCFCEEASEPYRHSNVSANNLELDYSSSVLTLFLLVIFYQGEMRRKLWDCGVMLWIKVILNICLIDIRR